MPDTNDPSANNSGEPKRGLPTSPVISPAEASMTDTTDDAQSDAAVDDIMKKDGDEVLKAQDEAAQKAVVMKRTAWERFTDWNASWWGNPRKRYATISTIVVLLGTLFAVPVTRYNILGLVLQSPITVMALDSKTHAPVSGAWVEIAGRTIHTEADGKAKLRVHAGTKTLRVSKPYYTGYTSSLLVTLSAGKNSYTAPLVAQGRQVKVKVVNKVSGAAVANAEVVVGNANAKTDKNGLATIVTPSGADSQDGNVTLSGFNSSKVSITAAGDVAKNTFALVPAGKLYFLSNMSGRIDVAKTDLDGSNRQTVLAGTGNEDRNATSLLASRDWKYLALLSKRAGQYASVYLIDTTKGDKLVTIDEGNADFSLVGWSDNNFVYQVTRNTVELWQPNRQALKSYSAANGQTLLLDQTQASGTGQADYTRQSFGSPYLIGSQVVYAKNWDASFNNWSQLATKSAVLDSIGVAGSGHKTIKSFTRGTTDSSGIFINQQLYAPAGLYVYFSNGTTESFYDYENGKITEDTSLTADKFYNTPYSTYLFSPAGSATFWAESRDGKNTLFTGDESAKNQKQIASLSSYNTYGWFTDDYLLVSKDSSELYIMSSAGGTPLKITDYYKPAVTYNGYGGGYGGR